MRVVAIKKKNKMPKKYKEIYELPIGIGRELRIKKSVEGDKLMFYLTVDEKFADEKYYTRRLKPEAAKEILINKIPDEIVKWEKGETTVQKKANILAECFNCSLQDYGGQGWEYSDDEGEFELTYGYGEDKKVEIYKNKKEVQKIYDMLNTEAVVWDRTSIKSELVTAKTYSEIKNRK